jgi:gamma-glutamyltranspeptidase/glutathione hydrolase
MLTAADLAAWSATYEAPATYDWNGWTVCKAGPWSQGPAFLQQLALLPAELPPYGSADYVHLLVEGCKLAMADREAWYGDAAEVPLADLLSGPYNAERRRLVGDKASYELRPGSPGGRVPRLSAHAHTVAVDAGEFDALGVGEPTVAKPPVSPVPGEPGTGADGATRGDTCHLDVVDRWGAMVSVTPSGGWLQSSPVIPELGFALGTRLQMTWLEEGLPSTLTPGRRPRTTLTPTLVLDDDGRPVTAVGSPGGDQQDQWQLLYLLRTLVGGWSPQAAIDAPAFHTTSSPGSFWPRDREPGGAVVEDRLGDDVIAGLARRGHRISRAGDWSLGRLSAVGIDHARGVLWGAANPRGMQGYAVGR